MSGKISSLSTSSYHIEAPKSGCIEPLHPPRVYKTIQDSDDPLNLFKVIDPKEIFEGYEFFFHKEQLIKCKGPARKLTLVEYIDIYYSCLPTAIPADFIVCKYPLEVRIAIEKI